MTASVSASPEQDARRRRTVLWVVGLVTVGLMFDRYDLVVFGTVVSTFLRYPTQIGPVTPGLARARHPPAAALLHPARPATPPRTRAPTAPRTWDRGCGSVGRGTGRQAWAPHR